MDAITSPTPNNSLRERMLQDMTMRGFGEHTQKDYIRHVRRFANFLGKPPDFATVEDLRRFQIDQHERAVGPATINGAVSALRFLFGITLKRPEMALGLVVMHYAPKLRVVLSVEETARLLEAAPGIKYKAARTRRTSRPSPAMPMLRRAYDYHRNLRPLVPPPRTAIIGTANPGECAMIRHGSACMTVAPMAHWPMTQRVPIPRLNTAQRILGRKANAARGLTPCEITLIQPTMALPARQRLPARTIPKPIYP